MKKFLFLLIMASSTLVLGLSEEDKKLYRRLSKLFEKCARKTNTNPATSCKSDEGFRYRLCVSGTNNVGRMAHEAFDYGYWEAHLEKRAALEVYEDYFFSPITLQEFNEQVVKKMRELAKKDPN